MKLDKGQSVTIGAKTYAEEIPDAIAAKFGFTTEETPKVEETPKPNKKGSKKK